MCARRERSRELGEEPAVTGIEWTGTPCIPAQRGHCGKEATAGDESDAHRECTRPGLETIGVEILLT
jgi:hypothetical protein